MLLVVDQCLLMRLSRKSIVYKQASQTTNMFFCSFFSYSSIYLIRLFAVESWDTLYSEYPFADVTLLLKCKPKA